MRPPSLPSPLRILLATMMTLIPTGLSTSTAPVSLSKFVPRIENLPSSCQAAYTAPIAGCTRDDFPANRDPDVNNCSAACVDGLVAIVQRVNEACATVRVPADSIIGVALLGNLLPQLCGKIVVVTEAPGGGTSMVTMTMSQSAVQVSTEGASAATTTAAEETTQTQTQSSAQATQTKAEESTRATTQQSSAETPSSSRGGLVLDTGKPPAPPRESNPADDGGRTIQKSNPDSGGGSPFDVVLAGSSGAASCRAFGVGVVLVALVLGAAMV